MITAANKPKVEYQEVELDIDLPSSLPERDYENICKRLRKYGYEDATSNEDCEMACYYSKKFEQHVAVCINGRNRITVTVAQYKVRDLRFVAEKMANLFKNNLIEKVSLHVKHEPSAVHAYKNFVEKGNGYAPQFESKENLFHVNKTGLQVYANPSSYLALTVDPELVGKMLTVENSIVLMFDCIKEDSVLIL